MTKYIRSIGISIGYMLLYLFLQLVYLIIAAFVYGLKQAVRGAGEEELMDGLARMLSINTHIAIIFATLFSIIIFYLASKKRGLSLLEMCSFKGISKKNILLSIIGGISFLFLNVYIIELIKDMTILADYMESFEEFARAISSANIALVLLSIGIIAPIAEEIVFRGLIMNELKKNMSVGKVVIIQAVLFGIFHLRVIQMIYTTILGLVLGLVLIWTKSLWAPIIMHIFYNLTSIMLSNYGQDTIFINYFNGFVVLSVIIIIFIMYYLYVNKAEDSNKDFIIFEE